MDTNYVTITNFFYVTNLAYLIGTNSVPSLGDEWQLQIDLFTDGFSYAAPMAGVWCIAMMVYSVLNRRLGKFPVGEN